MSNETPGNARVVSTRGVAPTLARSARAVNRPIGRAGLIHSVQTYGKAPGDNAAMQPFTFLVDDDTASDAAGLADRARRAEELGATTFVIPDHDGSLTDR